jgi:hypothetical protein
LGNVLINRVVPYPDESIRGYMIRLSQANRTTPRKLYKLSSLIAGVDPRSLLMITGKVDISKLCELTNVDEHCLLRSTFFYQMGMYGGEDEKILRHISSFGMCSTGFCQVCPVCLNEQPYHRKHWEIRVITTCHTHQCKLVSNCPKCKLYISPIRRFVTHCNCGFDLRRCNIEKVPKSETFLAEWIYGKLLNTQSSYSFSSNEVQELSLRHFLYLHILFCYYYFQVTSSQVKVTYSKVFKPIHLHETTTRTFQMFADWPRSFHSFIDNYRTVPKSYKGNEIFKEFGMFHYYLIRHFGSMEYSFVTKSFLDYCEVKSAEVPFLKKLKKRIEMKLSQTEKSLNVNPVDDNYVDMRTAVNILGISEYIIEDLIELGQIYMVQGKKGVRYCALESIRKIQKVYLDDVPLHTDIKETVNFQHIQTVLNRKIRISEFIVALLDGKIKPCGTIKEEKGLNRLLFRISDVLELPKEKGLTIQEAAELMMVKKQALYSWKIKGFILTYRKNTQ